MEDREYEHRLTDVESRCKSNTHRINELKDEGAFNRVLKENLEKYRLPKRE